MTPNIEYSTESREKLSATPAKNFKNNSSRLSTQSTHSSTGNSNSSSSKKWFPKLALKIPKLVGGKSAKKQTSKPSLKSHRSSTSSSSTTVTTTTTTTTNAAYSDDDEAFPPPPTPVRDLALENGRFHQAQNWQAVMEQKQERMKKAKAAAAAAAAAHAAASQNSKRISSSSTPPLSSLLFNGPSHRINVFDTEDDDDDNDDNNVINEKLQHQYHLSRYSNENLQLHRYPHHHYKYSPTPSGDDQEKEQIIGNDEDNIQREKVIKLGHRRSNSDALPPVSVQRVRSYSTSSIPSHNNYNKDSQNGNVENDEEAASHNDDLFLKSTDNEFNTATATEANSHDVEGDVEEEEAEETGDYHQINPNYGYANRTSQLTNDMKSATTITLTTPNNMESSIENSDYDPEDSIHSGIIKLQNNAKTNTKLLAAIESMQNQTCGNMTAREFALAVGINVDTDSSSSDESDDDRASSYYSNSIQNYSTNNSRNGGRREDDSTSLCSTLSQLTANGKIPTANEIYNALSIRSSGRQRRKHSAPALNLDMFIPPSSCSSSVSNMSTSYTHSTATSTKTTTTPISSTTTSTSSSTPINPNRYSSHHPNSATPPSNQHRINPDQFLNENQGEDDENKTNCYPTTNSNSMNHKRSNNKLNGQNKFGTLNSTSSNGTLYQNFQPVPPSSILTHHDTYNSTSNESNVTYVSTTPSQYADSVNSSAASIQTYSSSEVATMDEEDIYGSNYSTSYPLNSILDLGEKAKNNLTTTFYSLPRVTFSDDPTGKLNNNNNLGGGSHLPPPPSHHFINNGIGVYHGNYPCHMNSLGLGLANSNNSHIPQHRRSPSSISNSSYSSTQSNPNFYISNNNSTTTNAVAASKQRGCNDMAMRQPSPQPQFSSSYLSVNKAQAQSSWTEKDMPLAVSIRHPSMPVLRPKKTTTQYAHENQVKTYTKGRFTITHETFHNRKLSCHKFEIEKN